MARLTCIAPLFYLHSLRAYVPIGVYVAGGKGTTASAGSDVATDPRRVAAAGGSKLNMVATSIRPRPQMMGATLGYSRCGWDRHVWLARGVLSAAGCPLC